MSEKELKRIADSIEKLVKVYDDPAAFVAKFKGAFQEAMSPAQPSAPLSVSRGALPVTAATAELQITLTPDEKNRIVSTAMGEIEKQMDEFRKFIAQSLSTLPEASLKKIGKHLEEGKKFKLRKRGGCVHLDFGFEDEEFYLRL